MLAAAHLDAGRITAIARDFRSRHRNAASGAPEFYCEFTLFFQRLEPSLRPYRSRFYGLGDSKAGNCVARFTMITSSAPALPLISMLWVSSPANSASALSRTAREMM